MKNLLKQLLRKLLQEHFNEEECKVFWFYVELLSLRKTSEETGTTVWFVRKTIERIRTLLKSPPYNKIWEWFEPDEEQNKKDEEQNKEPDEPDEEQNTPDKEPDNQHNDCRRN